MAGRICPWWLGYALACPWRRFLQDPAKILDPYVREGMTVLEPGPGMGFFTLEIARRVGASGRVVVVDIQPRMLDALKRRAMKTGLLGRLDARMAKAGSLNLEGLDGRVDFAFACAMVHEVPDKDPFFRQITESLKPGGSLLVAEPPGHVNAARFEEELAAAVRAGLYVTDRPAVPRSRAALLRKEPPGNR